MKLSIIIPCRNAADTIHHQLEAISRQRWNGDWEVLVSDNGSTDDSMEIVQSFARSMPRLRVVRAERHQGAAHACNEGVAAATGEVLLFAGADDEAAANWLPTMAEALAAHEWVACGFDWTKLNHGPGRDRTAQTGQLQILWYPPYLPHTGSGGMGIWRSLHEKVHGFDESMYRLSDTDYCIRLQEAGHRLHFVPGTVMHVRLRKTGRGNFHQARLWAKYNALLYRKYRRPGEYFPRAWRKYFSTWKRLIRHPPLTRNKYVRAEWLWHCGWQVGALQGALQYRVYPV